MAFHLYSRGSARGIYLQNVIFFPTFLDADLRWGFDAIWNVAITLNASATVEYTTDGGITFFPINPVGGTNVAIPANDERTFNIKAGDKDKFNLRTIDAGGIDIYRVLISIAPQDIMRPRSDIDLIIPSPLDVNICPVTCDVPIINGSISPLLVSVGAPPVGTPNGVIILSKTNSVETANTDISGVDLSPAGTSAGEAVIFRIEWSASVVGVLTMTLDSTTFVEFNNGANLRADSLHLFDVVVEDGDLFNLQFNKNTTIRFLRVIQVL